MTYIPILNSEIAEGFPLDRLTLSKIQNNFEHFKGVSGVGGGAPQWSNDTGAGAVFAVANGSEIAVFDAGMAQEMVTAVRLPDSFEAGTVPKLRLQGYTQDNMTIRTNKFLVKVEVIEQDYKTPVAVQTYTTEVNSASAFAPLAFNANLSGLDGKVGTYALKAGNILRVTVSRGTDTNPSQLIVVRGLTEIKFTKE